MSLWTELKRRNVFRVGAAYAVIAWLLVQASDIMLGNFGAPDWVFKSFAALLALGFPLALFLSWAYELTPEGVKRSEEVPVGTSVTPATGKRIDRLILIGLVAVITVMAIERVWFAGVASDPVVGRLERMLEVSRKAAELDPLSPFLQARYAGRMVNAGQLAEARVHLDRSLRQFPGNDYLIESLADLDVTEARLAAALGGYRAVHFSRPGDPYSAARIAQLGIRLGEPEMARAWIAAARERGPDNRWELVARSDLARAADDWPELSRVGDLRGGTSGAEARGIAAARQGELPSARQHLLEALRLSGYDPARPALRIHTPVLIELARVERDFGLDGWRERIRAARATVEGLLAGGASSPNQNQLPEQVQLARIEALEGNRPGALETLRIAVAAGYREPWLARDPFFAEWHNEPEFQALLADIDARLAVERERIASMERLP